MKKILLTLVILLFISISISATYFEKKPENDACWSEIEIEEPPIRQTELIEKEPTLVTEVPKVVTHLTQIARNDFEIEVSETEIEELALLVMAEAESETEYGKRMVIDSVLNRVDHPKFPDTVHDVIFAPNAYSSMWNERVSNCEVTDEMIDLVCQELLGRFNYDVIYFRTGHYHSYGAPLFHIGNHYFSSYGNE